MDGRLEGSKDALLWGTPWRAVRPIGRVDVAELVEAEHQTTKERALVKVVSLESVEVADTIAARQLLGDRVRLETDALRALDHPNILRLLDAGQTPDGRPYFATPLQEDAHPLSEVIGRPMPPLEVIRIALGVLAALGAAHAKGIIHRDVKPRNILLTGERVILSDFGIAKVIERRIDGLVPLALPTAEGQQVTVARLRAPEQLLGKPVDARTDLYQVGLVMFECLVGRGPFDDKPGLSRSVPRLRSLVSSIPASLDAIVARALESEAADRHANADAFIKELVWARSALQEARGTEVMPALDRSKLALPGFSAPSAPSVTALPSLDATEAPTEPLPVPLRTNSTRLGESATQTVPNQPELPLEVPRSPGEKRSRVWVWVAVAAAIGVALVFAAQWAFGAR